MANPTLTCHELRVKSGVQDALAAEFFAVTVFLCDDILQLKTAAIANPPAANRFFDIACKLPMDLQTILCHRVVGSMKQNILQKDSEAAFKCLARNLETPTQATTPNTGLKAPDSITSGMNGIFNWFRTRTF